MTQDHRPPGLNIVKIAVAIHIIKIWAVGGIDKNGSATYAPKGAYRAIDSARQ
jgi:hypothetical protein